MQEYIVAHEIEFLIGTHRLTEDLLFLAIVMKECHDVLRSQTRQSQASDWLPIMTSFSPAHWKFVAQLSYNRQAWHKPTQHQSRGDVFHNLIRAAPLYRATDLRDRVYAFLGLMTLLNKPQFTINLSEPLQALEKRFTMYLLHDDKPEDVFYFCKGLAASGPSWTINLEDGETDMFTQFASLVWADRPFSAGIGPKFQFRYNLPRLYTTAIDLGTVSALSPYELNPRMSPDPSSWVDNGQTTAKTYQAICVWAKSTKTAANESLDEMSVWRTAFADIGDYTNIHRMSSTGLDEVLLELVAGFAAQADDILKQEDESDSSDTFDQDIKDISPYLYFVSLFAIPANKRLGLVNQTLPTLVPLNTEEGDSIVVIHGTFMPLVLRPSRHGFRVVGPAYVHGLMDGEALVEESGYKAREIELV
jgi:hypothetical protein